MVVLGQYNLVLLGIKWYWVSKVLLCLYILKKRRFGRQVLPIPDRHTHRQQNIGLLSLSEQFTSGILWWTPWHGSKTTSIFFDPRFFSMKIGSDKKIKISKLQRNVYISGLALFLALVIRRVVSVDIISDKPFYLKSPVYFLINKW